MKPFYKIIIDGNAIELFGRLISLRLLDKNGMEADELQLDLDDSDGQLAFPAKGAKLTAVFGFQGGTENRGDYIVDEITHQGPPDVLTIRARSADFRGALLEEREGSYHEATVGTILQEVAARQGLELAISADLAAKPVAHLDQTNESDANLITRLGQDYDAIATVKSGRLVFVPRGKGNTASGTPIPQATIVRQMGDKHTFTDADRNDRVTGVAAFWQDKAGGKRMRTGEGEKGYQRHLKQTFSSKEEAEAAAKAEMKRIQTGARKLTLNLIQGRADLFAEQPIVVSGFKPEIDQVSWFIKEVTHSINQSGYSCSLQCEELGSQSAEQKQKDESTEVD